MTGQPCRNLWGRETSEQKSGGNSRFVKANVVFCTVRNRKGGRERDVPWLARGASGSKPTWATLRPQWGKAAVKIQRPGTPREEGQRRAEPARAGREEIGQKKGPGRGWGGRYLPGRSRGKSGGALVISRAFAAVAANRKRALSALGGEEPTGRSRRKSGGALVISCAFAAVAANPKICFSKEPFSELIQKTRTI